MFLTKQYTITKHHVEPKVEMEEDLPKPYPNRQLDELISKLKM